MKHGIEDEHSLVSRSLVYPSPGERTPKKVNLISTVTESIASLKSFEKTRTINCRTVLWYMSFVGFMVNYIFRLNVNIAIVEMVSRKKATTTGYSTSECFHALNATVNSTFGKLDDVCTHTICSIAHDINLMNSYLKDFSSSFHEI